MKMHLKEAIDTPQDTHVRSNKQMRYKHPRARLRAHRYTHFHTRSLSVSHINEHLPCTHSTLSFSISHTHTHPSHQPHSRALARNGPLEMESSFKCNCTNSLAEMPYLMSVLKARGMMFTSGKISQK